MRFLTNVNRNQGYEFPAEYVVTEDATNSQMQAPSIVGLPAGLSVGTVYDNQQGKIIVPNDISHLQEPSMASYPPPIIVPDVVPVSDPKMDGDGTKRKKKVFVCTYEGCGKCFESQWGLTR